MPNQYEGPIDARQSDDEALTPSRFRPKYRSLSKEELDLHDAIKSKAAELEALFEQIPPGRYASLAMTDLEKAVMWAVKAVTA